MHRIERLLKNTVQNVLFVSLGIVLLNCEKQPSPPLSPAEALESFFLAEEELEIQLVAAEPMVQDPVAISFDEAGRLWVVEMLGFMTDIDGTGELDPVGRVSVLFDDNSDGRMDRSIVFLDSLVLPRAIAIVEEGVLVSENIPLWFAQDTDGDFKADKRILIDSTYGGSGMPEHSANGLWRGMDNWLYNAKSKYRYKKVAGEWIKDETEFRGQWGIVHDDAGRLFYNYNWSQLHADLVPPNALLANKNHKPSSGIDHGLTLEREIYPIRSNTAVNRGYVPGTLDDEGRLLEFASACGPLIYRGDALPLSFKGDAFVCEPTANLIKRNKIAEDGFMLNAKGAYENREFLASTDERFRPISTVSGPDGAIYVVDLYKGIIQHGPYMTPYLRQVTLDRGLDKPIHMGRIWRITSKKKNKEKPVDLSAADSKTLVSLLGHPNGWTRDTAQRLLVEKGAPVLSDLQEVLEQGKPLAQLHALWTLEGLNLVSQDDLLPMLRAQDAKVAQTALRLLMKSDSDHIDVKSEVTKFIAEYYDQAAPLLQMQMVLASGQIESKFAFDIAQKFLLRFGHLPVARDVVMSGLEDREAMMLANLLSQSTWKAYDQNREIFMEMLATAVANKGSLSEIWQLLGIVEKDLPEGQFWIKNALVNGMINAKGSNDTGEIVLNRRPSFLVDNKVYDKLVQKLRWPGKPKTNLTANDNRHDVSPEVLAVGRQRYLNLCANCHGTQGEGMARFGPPLAASEWVSGEDYKLAMILLHGMEGPITVAGKLYDTPDILPSMPSFTTLQNEDIAAIATYIRNSWGHAQSEISPGTVGRIRFRTQGKITPWKAGELDTLIFDTDL